MSPLPSKAITSREWLLDTISPVAVCIGACDQRSQVTELTGCSRSTCSGSSFQPLRVRTWKRSSRRRESQIQPPQRKSLSSGISARSIAEVRQACRTPGPRML